VRLVSGHSADDVEMAAHASLWCTGTVVAQRVADAVAVAAIRAAPGG
jgi:hypothetical protein